MSAEMDRTREDILHPNTWNDRTVATVSISPWYPVPDGSRVRTVNLICESAFLWEQVRKDKRESWSDATANTEAAVRKMLKTLDSHMHELSL